MAAPLGTHTGWNFYRAPELAGELCDRDGTFVPFAVTKAEREAAKDPRLSLEERYKDRKGWLGYLRATAATDLDLDPNSAGGVRIAGLGALWQAVMLGFAGLAVALLLPIGLAADLVDPFKR